MKCASIKIHFVPAEVQDLLTAGASEEQEPYRRDCLLGQDGPQLLLRRSLVSSLLKRNSDRLCQTKGGTERLKFLKGQEPLTPLLAISLNVADRALASRNDPAPSSPCEKASEDSQSSIGLIGGVGQIKVQPRKIRLLKLLTGRVPSFGRTYF